MEYMIRLGKLSLATRLVVAASALGFVEGCARNRVVLPRGFMPAKLGPVDSRATDAIAGQSPPSVEPRTDDPKAAFDVLRPLPGADSPPFTIPMSGNGTRNAEEFKKLKASFPKLEDSKLTLPVDESPEMSLEYLVDIGLNNNPSVQKAVADADVAYGRVVQAGLYPNPLVGYQVDQWQPGDKPRPFNNSGQQGAFVTQLIKTADKLSLTQQVVGYDYINALISIRESQINTTSLVRQRYFDVLISEQSFAVNSALANMSQQVYDLQVAQVSSGVSAAYEPLILYAQAVQAKNTVKVSESQYLSAWSRLAAAIGQPELKPVPLSGTALAEAPMLEASTLKRTLMEQHTDVLQARNLIAQSRTNLVLQRRIPIPDIQINNTQQHDNATSNYQFGLQVGVILPVADRNQGNIRSATARIVSTTRDLENTQNQLQSQFAEAFSRYEVNVLLARSFRDAVIPNLTQGYQAIVRRYQVDPEKVSFNDIVVAQLGLAQSLQAYLDALRGQWQAVVDVATIAQLDDLYSSSPAIETPEPE